MSKAVALYSFEFLTCSFGMPLKTSRDFPAVQWLRHSVSSAERGLEGVGSIPGRGTRIPHGGTKKQKQKQKQKINKF